MQCDDSLDTVSESDGERAKIQLRLHACTEMCCDVAIFADDAEAAVMSDEAD